MERKTEESQKSLDLETAPNKKNIWLCSRTSSQRGYAREGTGEERQGSASLRGTFPPLRSETNPGPELGREPRRKSCPLHPEPPSASLPHILLRGTRQVFPYPWSPLMITTIWVTEKEGRCYHPYFTHRETKAQTRSQAAHRREDHSKKNLSWHQTPYFDALGHQTQSRWFCFHDETKVILTSKAVIYFVWALLLNLSGLRTFWLGSWQNEAHFEQPHRQGFLCKQRQARECFLQSAVLTAVLLITYYSFFYLF